MEIAQREDKASQRLEDDGMKSDSGADQMQSQVYSSCLTSNVVREIRSGLRCVWSQLLFSAPEEVVSLTVFEPGVNRNGKVIVRLASILST